MFLLKPKPFLLDEFISVIMYCLIKKKVSVEEIKKIGVEEFYSNHIYKGLTFATDEEAKGFIEKNKLSEYKSKKYYGKKKTDKKEKKPKVVKEPKPAKEPKVKEKHLTLAKIYDELSRKMSLVGVERVEYLGKTKTRISASFEYNVMNKHCLKDKTKPFDLIYHDLNIFIKQYPELDYSVEDLGNFKTRIILFNRPENKTPKAESSSIPLLPYKVSVELFKANGNYEKQEELVLEVPETEKDIRKYFERILSTKYGIHPEYPRGRFRFNINGLALEKMKPKEEVKLKPSSTERPPMLKQIAESVHSFVLGLNAEETLKPEVDLSDRSVSVETRYLGKWESEYDPDREDENDFFDDHGEYEDDDFQVWKDHEKYLNKFKEWANKQSWSKEISDIRVTTSEKNFAEFTIYFKK